MSKLDVHYYDGHWEEVCDYIDKAKLIADKIPNINALRKRLEKYGCSAQAMANFNIIASSNTYDPINKIHVHDLLYILEEVCKGYEDCTDLLKMIVEQLEDMSTGLCAQGRTTRLHQLMVSFVEEEHIL
jgi:hypothetical protein